MNKLTIVGNLTADPVLKTVTVGGNEVKVANFTVAVNEKYGQTAKTTFFKVHAWRGLGETCAEYLKKGRKVLIEGPVRLNSYKDNTGAYRYDLEVRGDAVEFLDKKPEEEEDDDFAPEFEE